mgnify:CR=1 FL=1
MLSAAGFWSVNGFEQSHKKQAGLVVALFTTATVGNIVWRKTVVKPVQKYILNEEVKSFNSIDKNLKIDLPY